MADLAKHAGLAAEEEAREAASAAETEPEVSEETGLPPEDGENERTAS